MTRNHIILIILVLKNISIYINQYGEPKGVGKVQIYEVGIEIKEEKSENKSMAIKYVKNPIRLKISLLILPASLEKL